MNSVKNKIIINARSTAMDPMDNLVSYDIQRLVRNRVWDEVRKLVYFQSRIRVWVEMHE